MAGRLGKCRYCRAMLAVMTVAFVVMTLAVTNVWDPRPAIDAFLARLVSLSTPAPLWTGRAAGEPDSAAVMRDGTTVVASRGFVNGYARADGAQLWQLQVNWVLTAEDVVVAQQRPANPDQHPGPQEGYSVIDPVTGKVLWGDPVAIAAWGYTTSIIDLVCPGSGSCQLRSHEHRNAAVTWSVDVPASAKLIRGANPTLAGTRDPADWFARAALGTPGVVPPVFALPLEGHIQLVDTFKHALVREVIAPDRLTRVAASGDSLLFIHAERATSGCVYSVNAVNFATGDPAWHQDGFNLDTASGAGCEQRKDPLGADRHLVVTSSANAPMVVEADSGRAAWTGVPGQKVLATGYGIAVVESADRKTVEVVDVLGAQQRVTWAGAMGLDPQAAVTADWVIIRDGDAGRILVFSRIGMAKRLEIKSTADVIGYGPSGILLASGRRIGFQPVRA